MSQPSLLHLLAGVPPTTPKLDQVVVDETHIRTTVGVFRAYLIKVGGPFKAGEYQLTLGTDRSNRDAMWALDDHPGEFFEVTVRTVREIDFHDPQTVDNSVDTLTDDPWVGE